MYLKSLTYRRFRNLEDHTIEPSKTINVLVGHNAQGKTNVLESIHVCCAGRSHRTAKDRELITFSKDDAYIDARCIRRDGEHRIEIGLSATNKKAVSINGTPAKRLGELMGHMNAVMFSPEDLSLVKDGPSWRRRFIDMALSQMSPVYFYDLQHYLAALQQRNTLLKDIANKGTVSDTLPIWDQQLAIYGAKLIVKRKDFIKSLKEICLDIHGRLSGGQEELRLGYQPMAQGESEVEIQESLIAYFEKNRDYDIRRGITQGGPHRDDVKLMLGDQDVRSFGSQGQQRTCALSIKLSEITIMRETTHEAPLLLLDDVFSELDGSRRRWLLDYIGEVQTFITCVDMQQSVFKEMDDVKIYEVKSGNLEEK